MAIIIIKKGAVDQPPPAEIVKEPEKTREVAVPVVTREIPRAPRPDPIMCAFCKKEYLKPCHEGNYKGCANWFYITYMKDKEDKKSG